MVVLTFGQSSNSKGLGKPQVLVQVSHASVSDGPGSMGVIVVSLDDLEDLVDISSRQQKMTRAQDRGKIMFSNDADD